MQQFIEMRTQKMALNKQSIRDLNEKSVLRQIFVEGPISRIQISRNLKLNKSTVSAIFNDLSDRQLVMEMGQGQSTQVGGRKPVMIKVNQKYGYTLNFDIGFRHLDMMANYLDGTAFQYTRFETAGYNINQVLDLIIESVNNFKNPDTVNGLLGISVAVHGIVYQNQVTYSPFIDMEDVSIYERLTATFTVPIVVDNEANLVAVFQRDFSHDEEHNMNNIVVISIHKGIGAGIIINHQIYRGEKGEAGEIGRAIYPTVFAEPGRVEKIENYASQDAIIDLIKNEKKLDELDFDDVAQMYSDGDKVVVKAINDFRDYITMIVYNAAVSYNPDTIYLSSNLIETIDQLLPMINNQYNLLPENGNTDIRMLRGAKYASLLGGCSSVTHLALKMSGQQLKFNFDLNAAGIIE